MQKSIQRQLFFSHSAEIVWEYLTRPELIALWLMKNNFEPTLGHEFQFRHNPMPALGFDGNVYCTVLEVAPFRKLVYSWKGGPGNGVITLDSLVVWTLHPTENGTELHLVHSGFKHEDQAIYSIMDAGWLKNMLKIDTLIKGA